MDDDLFSIYKAYWTHWGRVTHIGIGNLTIIASDNGLLPGQHQAIIWTNDGILSSSKWWPFCLGLNVLKIIFPNEAWWYYTKLNESGEALYIP